MRSCCPTVLLLGRRGRVSALGSEAPLAASLCLLSLASRRALCSRRRRRSAARFLALALPSFALRWPRRSDVEAPMVVFALRCRCAAAPSRRGAARRPSCPASVVAHRRDPASRSRKDRDRATVFIISVMAIKRCHADKPNNERSPLWPVVHTCRFKVRVC